METPSIPVGVLWDGRCSRADGGRPATVLLDFRSRSGGAMLPTVPYLSSVNGRRRRRSPGPASVSSCAILLGGVAIPDRMSHLTARIALHSMARFQGVLIHAAPRCCKAL